MICKCSVKKYLEITYTCSKSEPKTEVSKSRSKRYIGLGYNLGPEPYGYDHGGYDAGYGSDDHYDESKYNDNEYSGNNGRKYGKGKKNGKGYNKRRGNKNSYKVRIFN